MNWKEATRQAQDGLCLICGEPIDGLHGSWDHFVPIVASGRGATSLRIGLAYWTHHRCNSARGHAPPTPAMLARAAHTILCLPRGLQAQASTNLDATLRLHEAYVAAVGDLARRLAR